MVLRDLDLVFQDLGLVYQDLDLVFKIWVWVWIWVAGFGDLGRKNKNSLSKQFTRHYFKNVFTLELLQTIYICTFIISTKNVMVH